MKKEKLDSMRRGEGQAVSLDALGEMEDFEAQGRVDRLHSEGLTLLQVEKQLRMRHVLSRMNSDEAELLFQRFVGRRTYADLAEELGISHVAVLKRVRTATQNFKCAFAEHWLCPLNPEDLTNSESVLDLPHG